jgi:hypothetical protein
MYIIYGIKTLVRSWIVKVDPAKIADAGRCTTERAEEERGRSPCKEAAPGANGMEWWRG